MSLDIVPATFEHYIQLVPRDIELESIEAFAGEDTDTKFVMKHYIEKSYAFTGIAEEGIVGIAGIMPMWKGVAEGWFFSSDLVQKYHRPVIRAMKTKLDFAQEEFKIHRLQARTADGFYAAEKFLRLLGFEYEGPLVAFCTQAKDYHLYTRIRKDLWQTRSA